MGAKMVNQRQRLLDEVVADYEGVAGLPTTDDERIDLRLEVTSWWR
jgi:hypothetical protein